MNNDLLEHRGYFGSVQYSAEDDCLYGKVEFIDDLVLYDGDSAPAIRTAFQEAVDSYLLTCAERGVDPNTTWKGTFNVRVGTDLHRRAAIAARRRQQSLNDLIKDAVSRFLEQEEGPSLAADAESQLKAIDDVVRERLAQSTAFTVTTLNTIWQAAQPAPEHALHTEKKLSILWHESSKH